MASSTRQQRIRVLIADDHALIRAGVRLALAQAPDLELVGEVASGDQVHETCRELAADVLLLDLSMPGPSATSTVRYLRTHCPSVRVIILTAFDDDAYVRALVGEGARGYVLKEDTIVATVEAVRAVMAGGTWFSPAVVPALLTQAGRHVLTEREEEVLSLVALGRSNGAIAQELGVSVRTAAFHMSNLMAKLDARSRTEVVHRARDKGLLPTLLTG